MFMLKISLILSSEHSMKNILIILFTLWASFSFQAFAQLPVEKAHDHKPLLNSTNPVLAANKKLVYDFWREIMEGGRLDLVEKYLAESYIQHNPNVPTGRAGFVKFFSQFAKPKPIEKDVKAPLVSIVAERDIVIVSFVHELTDPKNATKKYTTTWFDMFRIKDGKIVEHWDSALKQ